MNGTDNLKRSSTQSSFGKGLRRSDSFVEEERHQKRRHDILACLEEGTEGCITLVGSIDDIDRPVVAFVRMAEAIALEVEDEITKNLDNFLIPTTAQSEILGIAALTPASSSEKRLWALDNRNNPLSRQKFRLFLHWVIS